MERPVPRPDHGAGAVHTGSLRRPRTRQLLQLPTGDELSGRSDHVRRVPVSGLAGGEDLAFLTAHRASATSSPSVDETLESWSKSYEQRSPCYWISIPTGQGNGIYSLQVFAGPSLVEASNAWREDAGLPRARSARTGEVIIAIA